jgi:hypothetical protein
MAPSMRELRQAIGEPRLADAMSATKREASVCSGKRRAQIGSFPVEPTFLCQEDTHESLA